MALAWERRYGVAPTITTTISEYDAARLVGHTDESCARQAQGWTAVARGWDFEFGRLRFQVKANRPSGKPGSTVTVVGKARNYEWDRLIWIRYDEWYRIQEAWERTVDAYRQAFDACPRLCPSHMRGGRRLA